jgi:ParB/RepB/Spo0J family partition protein
MTTTLETERLQQIPIDKIAECEHNPRRHFDAERLAELSASVLEHGVLTPLLVRTRPRGKTLFELAAGHRRLRAAKAAGLKIVPAIVREMDDRQFAEVLCIENLQRQDLDELDEAEGFRQLRELAGYDVPTIALKLSRSDKYVYDRLKLLDLVPQAQELLRRGLLHAGHGILIARLPEADQERAIDPDVGGAFEEEVPDNNGLFDDDLERSRPVDGPVDRWDGVKAKTVRELEAWINAHVRLDREVLDPVYDPAAHSLFAAQASEEALKVVPITRLHAVPPTARADERTLCGSSWKRADGGTEHDWRGREKATKTCEHAVKGVVVVGPGRGEVFDICTAKKACRVHWKDEQKQSEQRSERVVSNKRSDSAWERQKAQREQRTAAYEKVLPTLEALVREKVGKMDLDPSSKSVQESFRDIGEGYELSAADCGALLKRSRDGWRAIVELRALALIRDVSTYNGLDPVRDIRRADALLGGGQLGKAYEEALKGVQTSALAAKREAAKAAKASAKAPKGSKAKGKAKRAGRAGSGLALVLTLAGALVLLALGGCNGPGWARVASTLEVGAGNTDHRADDALGNPIYADSTQVWVTVRPLAFLEPPKEVIVVGGKSGGEK